MTTFRDFHLSDGLYKAIAEMGFETPSPIQAEAIPHLMKGADIIGQAQTGTGKTAAFAIPVLEKLEAGNTGVQALVLCPTRELAMQVAGEFQKLAKYRQNVLVSSIYGGQPIEKQINVLRRRPQIVVGTPGRVMDLMARGFLKIDGIKTMILDEADEMLNMGFRPDIEKILAKTPHAKQTMFFSATMPPAILALTEKYLIHPHHIKALSFDQPVTAIEQLYYEVQRKKKPDALAHLMNENHIGLALVFCNTKWQVDALVKRLKSDGYSADGLHGGMTQSRRTKTMQNFRKGNLRLLVATDVAARGLDVDNIEAVFNYDLPKDTEFYVHRIGRTGRAGKHGRAYTFVEQSEFSQLRQIRRYPNVNLSRQELPALA